MLSFGILLLGGLIFPHCSWAQLPQLWTQLYVQHRAEGGFYWEADAGYRGNALGSDPTTGLARIGAGVHFKSGNATAGIAWFETFPTLPSGFERADIRLHQKLVLRQSFKFAELSHVYRIEERWIQRANHSGYDFRVRFRYQLQLQHAIQKFTLLSAEPYLTANTEIFLQLDNRIFNQYRLYGGLGLSWNRKWRWEVGYLNQWRPGPLDIVQDRIVRCNLTYSF